MHLRLKTPIDLPKAFKEISHLTDRASITLGEIKHDNLSACVEMPLQRKELLGFNKTWLGRRRPIYGEKTISSFVKIRNVIRMAVDTDEEIADHFDGRFTLLMGIQMANQKIHLSSVEESRGKHLCHIVIEIAKVDFELYDL